MAKTKPKNLVKQAELARKAGVSEKSICLAVRRSLKDAVCDNMIDLNHESVKFYIKEQKVKQTLAREKSGSAPKTVKKSVSRAEKVIQKAIAPDEISSNLPSFQGLSDEFIASLLGKTLNEIVNLYGNEERFKTWLDSYKKVIETRAKELDLETKQGSLVSRELLEKYIFGYWDGLQERLLNDVPKSVTTRLQALFNSGGSVEDAENAVKEIISKQIKGAKSKAKRTLSNA